MELKDISTTNFALLQAHWTPSNCLKLLQSLQATYVIVAHRDAIHDQFYLFRAYDLSDIIKRASHAARLYDAIVAMNCSPVPGLAGDADAEEAPDQCVVLEDGSPVGFYDASIPPDEITRHSGPDQSAFAMPSLLADAPESVTLGGTASCLVWISVDAVAGMPTAHKLPVPSGEAVDVVIQGRQGVVILGQREAQLIVPEQDETLPIRFQVRGIEPGLGYVKIFIYHKDQLLGLLSHPIIVFASSERYEPGQRSQTLPTHTAVEAFGPHPDFSFPLFEHLLQGHATSLSQAEDSGVSREQASERQGNSQIAGSITERCYLLWDTCDAASLVLHLHINNTSIEANTPLQAVMAAELCTLLEQLFINAQTVIVEEFTHGFSGSRVLKIHPHFKDRGGARSVVVKFGAVQDLLREYQNYLNEVQYYIGEGKSTVILNYQQTTSLGGIIYSLQGSDFERIQGFGAFYQQATFSQIQHVLDTIFFHVCGWWYTNRTKLQPLNLTKQYQRPESNVLLEYEESIIGHLPFIQFQPHLVFAALQPAPERSFTNPFNVLRSAHGFVRSVYIATTHGDLNQNNILIDSTGSPWLIDFQDTGPSHVLRDVATLDTVIRFQILYADQTTLAEFLHMEQKLYTATHFSQLEDLKSQEAGDNPVLNKVYKTVLHLRLLANRLAPRHDGDAMSEYYIALFYLTMRTLTYFSLAREQRERALLSASLLADIVR